MTTKKVEAPQKYVTDQNGKRLVPDDFVITQKADGFPNWNGSVSQIQKVESIHQKGTTGGPLRLEKSGWVKVGRFVQDEVYLSAQGRFIEKDDNLSGRGYFLSRNCVKVKLTADDKLAWSQDYE